MPAYHLNFDLVADLSHAASAVVGGTATPHGTGLAAGPHLGHAAVRAAGPVPTPWSPSCTGASSRWMVQAKQACWHDSGWLSPTLPPLPAATDPPAAGAGEACSRLQQLPVLHFLQGRPAAARGGPTIASTHAHTVTAAAAAVEPPCWHDSGHAGGTKHTHAATAASLLCNGCSGAPVAPVPMCTCAVSLAVQVRQSAGLVLKNNLRTQYQSTSEDFRNYIKVCVGVGRGRRWLRRWWCMLSNIPHTQYVHVPAMSSCACIPSSRQPQQAVLTIVFP